MAKNYSVKMWRSIGEKLQRLNGGRISYKLTSDILQTRIWLESIFREEKINRFEFSQKLSPDRRESTGIVLRWLKGIHTARKSRVETIATVFPGSEAPYKLPIFRLLRNKPISEADLNEIMAPFIFSVAGLNHWVFPQPTHKENMGLPFPPSYVEDTDALVERGDIYGFTAILYLVRMAEVKNRSNDHQQYLKDAYQAMPGLCRHKYFQKRWRELFNCVFELHCRVPTSTLLVRPKVSIIEKQIHSAWHTTRRSLRPRDPNTLRFTELELTYEEASFYKERFEKLTDPKLLGS